MLKVTWQSGRPKLQPSSTNSPVMSYLESESTGHLRWVVALYEYVTMRALALRVMKVTPPMPSAAAVFD